MAAVKRWKSAFVCVRRRFADWTGKHTASTSNAAYKRENPYSSTLITTVISPICPSPALQKKTEINSDRLWKRATLWCAGSPSHRNVAFSISNCLHRCFSCHALCKVVITVLLYSYRFRVIYKPSRWLSHDFFLLTFSRQISKAGSGNHNRTTGAAPRRFS